MGEILFIAIAKYVIALLGGFVAGVLFRRKPMLIGLMAIIAGIAFGYVLGWFVVQPMMLEYLQAHSRPSVRLF